MAKTELTEITNFRQLADTIATAGQPTEAQFTAIQQAGYQVIVNLALPTSTNALPQEAAIVEGLGMQYVHIPVVWEQPNQEDFSQFAAAMQAHQNQPVFVHCALNMRVSAFMYLYRRIYQGIPETEAKRELEQIWVPNDRWQAFIDQILTQFSVKEP